ncbi:hypothetical protein SLS60_002399 [Paraconiothyrium brasiliense]|uniref:Major facilitator superfamily (MFS) profile domain-containing protein n=1 Tax=Paraconiothyrium brasiliense TaxID=300254 RepID=A0ABR3S221_9PLEO
MGFLQHIVKNDSTKSDPPEIYNGRVFLVCLVYGLKNKSPTELANLSSNIVSVIQAGAFAGALFASWLANKIGRRWSLIYASFLLFAGVACQAGASGHIEVLYVGRLLAGLAVGIASTVNPLYVSENAPRGIRGLLTGLYQLTLVSGLTLAFWINYGSNLHLHGHIQYVLPLALQAVPGVTLCVGMFFANESPRWLAQKNPTKALQVLATLRGLPPTHQYVVDEMTGIEFQLEEERALTSGNSAWSMLKEAFTGLALFYVGFYIRFDPPVKGQPISAAGYVALVMIYIFASVYQFGWGPVVWTYSSEIPPTRLRALMMGMAVASQWLFNFVVAKATPSMFATLGKNGFGTYFVYGSFCFVMVIYAWFLVPETKGISLEHMDELFSQNNVRKEFVPTPRAMVWESDADVKGVEDTKLASEHVERI